MTRSVIPDAELDRGLPPSGMAPSGLNPIESVSLSDHVSCLDHLRFREKNDRKLMPVFV